VHFEVVTAQLHKTESNCGHEYYQLRYNTEFLTTTIWNPRGCVAVAHWYDKIYNVQKNQNRSELVFAL